MADLVIAGEIMTEATEMLRPAIEARRQITRRYYGHRNCRR